MRYGLVELSTFSICDGCPARHSAGWVTSPPSRLRSHAYGRHHPLTSSDLQHESNYHSQKIPQHEKSSTILSFTPQHTRHPPHSQQSPNPHPRPGELPSRPHYRLHSVPVHQISIQQPTDQAKSQTHPFHPPRNLQPSPTKEPQNLLARPQQAKPRQPRRLAVHDGKVARVAVDDEVLFGEFAVAVALFCFALWVGRRMVRLHRAWGAVEVAFVCAGDVGEGCCCERRGEG